MKKSTDKSNQNEISKKTKSVLQEKLVASELRYRRLFESTKDGILILDAETGKIVDVNQFLIDLLGYSKKEFIEKSIWEIGAFHDIIENKDKFIELQQTEYVRYENLPLETSDGNKILVEFISNVYLVNNDKVIQCQIRDITARKESEAALEKTRKELAEIKEIADELNKFTENVIDTVREPLLAIDENLRVIKASRSFYNFFRVTAEETIGKLIYELGNHQWDIPKLRELLEEIIPEKNPFDNYEVEHHFSTIGKRVMLLNARQVRRTFGQEKIILLAIEDITERKGKEDALKETHRATSDILDNLLDHMHMPIVIWDASFVIKSFNSKFEKLSGYDSAEVIGKKIDFLFPKDKIAATRELLKNHLDDEHLEVAEIDILTKDNTIKTALWSSSRILDEEGKNIIATISQDITRRRQSELALRKSESNLRTLVRTIPDLIWLKDTKGVYLLCNPMFERFFGASETDIIGKTDYDFVDRELADFFCENDRKAMEADKPTSNEEWVTFADDGHRAFLDTIKSPIYDSNGTLLGVLGIGRDITERKLSGQVLQASEKRFRAIFDQAPIAIAMIDFQGFPILSNLRLSKMLGYTKDELYKMKFSEFTHPDDIDKGLNQFTDLIAGKISGFSMEKRYIHKDGYLIWANLFVTALNDNNGVPQEIIGMVEDISEQKKIHNEIKFQADLINNVGQAVIATDLQGNVTYWNSAAEKIYGWSTSEAIGKNIIHLTPAQQSNEQAIDIMKKLSAGKTWSGEFLVKRKDGSSFPAFVTDTPIFDSNGKLAGIIGISSDITERKKMVEDLVTAKEKAEESDRLKSAFLANMSHEIRTPMNGILGFTNLLLEPDLSSEEKESFINIVHQSGQRMLNTVTDIIEISKIEAGLVNVIEKETDLNGRLIELTRFFQLEAEKKGLKLILEKLLPSEKKNLLTDQNKLDSILTNLIKNAIKYTPTGEIRVGCEIIANYLKFYIKDTGIGIPAHRQEAVFNRFEQADITFTRVFEGSGLGLAIAKSYVEMLGGKIWVESEEGLGSTFYFTLPLSEQAQEKTEEKETGKQDYKISPIKGLNIIIAEDDENSALFLQTILKKESNKILLTKNGHETVEACRINPDADLVLMDINMPEMDGYEATRQIREFNKEVIIIAQTAHALTGDREKAIEAGCNNYISKPINSVDLKTIVNQYFLGIDKN